MKAVNTWKICFAVASALAAAGFASAGEKEGNGGEAYALEFKSTAREILKKMRQIGQDGFKFSLDALETAIDDTEVRVVKVACIQFGPLPCPDALVRDAANFPEQKLIHLSGPRWELIRTQDEPKQRLVLHEYFGILGLEKSDDAQSFRALTELNPNFQAWKRLEGKALEPIAHSKGNDDNAGLGIVCAAKVLISTETGEIDLESIPRGNCHENALMTLHCYQDWRYCALEQRVAMVGLWFNHYTQFRVRDGKLFVTEKVEAEEMSACSQKYSNCSTEERFTYVPVPSF